VDAIVEGEGPAPADADWLAEVVSGVGGATGAASCGDEALMLAPGDAGDAMMEIPVLCQCTTLYQMMLFRLHTMT